MKPSGAARRPGDLEARLREYALAVVRVVDSLPRGPGTDVLGRQFLRSATSVGAHCREARRARSDAEFVSKLEVGIQELDKAVYWCELLVAAGYGEKSALERIAQESEELLAIFVTIVKNVKGKA